MLQSTIKRVFRVIKWREYYFVNPFQLAKLNSLSSQVQMVSQTPLNVLQFTDLMILQQYPTSLDYQKSSTCTMHKDNKRNI